MESFTSDPQAKVSAMVVTKKVHTCLCRLRLIGYLQRQLWTFVQPNLKPASTSFD